MSKIEFWNHPAENQQKLFSEENGERLREIFFIYSTRNLFKFYNVGFYHLEISDPKLNSKLAEEALDLTGKDVIALDFNYWGDNYRIVFQRYSDFFFEDIEKRND